MAPPRLAVIEQKASSQRSLGDDDLQLEAGVAASLLALCTSACHVSDPLPSKHDKPGAEADTDTGAFAFGCDDHSEGGTPWIVGKRMRKTKLRLRLQKPAGGPRPSSRRRKKTSKVRVMPKHFWGSPDVAFHANRISVDKHPNQLTWYGSVPTRREASSSPTATLNRTGLSKGGTEC